MAVTVRHATLTAVPDDPAYDVGADEWNAYHTVTNAVDKTGDTMTGQMTVAQGTITTSQPFTWTQTWNAGAVTFTALKLNVTNTASAAGSLLADLQVGGVSKVSANKDGFVTARAYNAIGGEGFYVNGNSDIGYLNEDSNRLTLSSYGTITFKVHNGSSYAERVRIVGSADASAGCVEMVEITAPSAPASNTVRIYAEDNGSGKTRLMALFPSGAAQQIAIEP